MEDSNTKDSSGTSLRLLINKLLTIGYPKKKDKKKKPEPQSQVMGVRG